MEAAEAGDGILEGMGGRGRGREVRVEEGEGPGRSQEDAGRTVRTRTVSKEEDVT